MLVRIQALLIQLVLEHSLRIRLKAESSGDRPFSRVVTPSTSSIIEERSGEASPESDSASEYYHAARDENETQGSSTVVGRLSRNASQTKSKGKRKANSKDAARRRTRDTENLLGRINNLVTSDLDAIADGIDFLTFGINIF